MRYTLRQLEVFVAVARCENVSQAAGALHLSQSATSTALAELERQLGQSFFDRHGKRLRLNEQGRLLLPKAVDLLDRAGELESSMLGEHAIGSLRIGATLTIGNYLMPLIAARFLQRHPTAAVQLHVNNTAHIHDLVARHELDCALVEGRLPVAGIDSEVWLADELSVFCAPEHPLAARGTATLTELAAQDWILREPGSGTRATLEHALRHRPGGLQVRLELEHTEAIKRAVESGLGISCISRLALRDAFRRGSLVPVATPELDLRRNFLFIWHRDKYHTTTLRAFLDECRTLTAGAHSSDDIHLPVIR